MNFARVMLLALIFGCTVPGLHAQKKNKVKDNQTAVRASGREGDEKQEDPKPTLKIPKQIKSQANAKNTKEFVIKARIESERLATAYGIEDKESQKKLLKACRKYYKAKELLEAEHGSNLDDSPDKKTQKRLQQRANILEREYGKELRRILPES